ncbi:hypothetical protein PF672P2_00046 [Parabacteroides phage PF672P2]|nr:hypothetical protein PF672P2_00046 [Parabacteroides phage PF672P2]
MNIKERETIEKVIAVLMEPSDNSSETGVGLLRELLLADKEVKPKKVALKDGGIGTFLYKSDLYPTEEACPFPINVARGRISSADMYEYYLVHCDAQGALEMNPKQLKSKLISSGFVYKNSLSINGKITTGYILFTDKDVHLEKIYLTKK